MKTHKVATLSLRWLEQLGNFICKFWRLCKFWYAVLLIFLQSLKAWVNVPSLFTSFNTFFFASILFMVCVCLLTSEYFAIFSAYVFSVCSWENVITLLKNRAHSTKNEVLSFLIRISSVNATIFAGADLVTFTKEILNGKLHLLCCGYLDKFLH